MDFAFWAVQNPMRHRTFSDVGGLYCENLKKASFGLRGRLWIFCVAVNIFAFDLLLMAGARLLRSFGKR